MPIPLSIPSLIGGVSRLAQSQRRSDELEVADNVFIDLPDGISKRAASILVKTTELTADTPTQDKHIGWIDRDADERFFFVVDPVGCITTLVMDALTVAPRAGDRMTQLNTTSQVIVVQTNLATNTIYVIWDQGTATPNDTVANTWTDGDDLMLPDPAVPSTVTLGTKDIDEIVEVFDISDGSEETLTQPPDEVLAYIAYNSWVSGYDPARRLRTLTIADTTLILARNVPTALRGADITYQDGGASNVRDNTNSHNVTTWSNLDQPPTTFSSVPDLTGEFGAGATINNAAIWFTQEDDIGRPRSWWWATTGTQPPWYTQIRTEGANSMIDDRTFPMRLDFSGTSWSMQTATWNDRYSGDSATNPGPSFIGSGISDLSYHQDRLFLASGEVLASSQAGDLFNLWVESEQLGIDSDPIDTPTSNNRVSNIDFIVPFREALLLTTSGSKQFELRADGPLGPNTAFLTDTTSVQTVNYVEPASLADQVYFVAERNFANVLYEYFFDPDQSSNKANDITRPVRGYIPAQISQMVAATAHNTLFMLTDAEKANIYCYKPVFDEQNRKVMSSFFRWTFEAGTEILSINVFDEDLYMVVRRNSLLWLEKVAVEQPEVDVVNVTESMGYQVRLDQRLSLQGVYDATANSTRWTIPFVDLLDDNYEIVLGPGWDVDVGGTEQRLAGTRFDSPTVTDDGSNSFLTVPGQYEDNLNGDSEIAYVGKKYTMTAELSEQFARSEEGRPLQGTVRLLSGKIRHKDTGFYGVRVTALNRTARTYEFIFTRTGSTALDAEFIEDDGLFEFRNLGKAHSTKIEIVNDSPLPSTIVDLEFLAMFRPSKKDPTR